MAKNKLKLQALELRKKGLSYSLIKSKIKVSKSTLSLWLRDYPLPKERIRELRDHSQQRIEKFRNTMSRKRQIRLDQVYLQEQKKLLPLTNRELYLAGLFLYWGEGGKTTTASICISNTDPKMIKFSLYWYTRGLKIPKSNVKVKLHLYADMNPHEEISFWSQQLNLSKKQFNKPYIKKTTLKGLTYKGIGHGTCNLIVQGQDNREKIIMGIKAISDYYSRTS